MATIGENTIFWRGSQNTKTFCDQNYLLKRMSAEHDSSLSSGPFQIIHNYRTLTSPRIRPKRKASACERYHPLPELTMRTRKMTEEIEHSMLPSPENSQFEERKFPSDPPRLLLEGQSFFERREAALENGIPLGGSEVKEGLFSFNENSRCSNYSKLERALFGFTMLDEQMEEE